LSIQLDFITAFENFRWIVAFLIIAIIMTVIYYVVPNVRWSFKYSLPGAAFATIGFLLISQLFSLYVGVAGNQAIGNSAIGVVITLLLWLYLMGTVLILGGFLNVMLYHYFQPLPVALKEESRYLIRYSKNALALSVNEQSLKRRLIRKKLRIQTNKQADI
jgi:membrane protein